MDVSVVIPVQASDRAAVAATLQGVFDQQYDGGRVDVFVVQYGGGDLLTLPSLPSGRSVRFFSVEHPSPYAARNLAARAASGEVLLFTEPGCVPDPHWVGAHVTAIRDSGITLSVGHVAPMRETWALTTFLSYEDARDAWVFSGQSWRHLFGRPKNMAIARHRFQSHGPFVEVMRGADSKLVQHVAREISPREVGHTPSAIVRQQDVHGLPSLFRDRFVHAQALRLHNSSHAAPIRLEDRIGILRRTAAEHGYGPTATIALLGFLASGILAFRLGGASARFVRRPAG